MSVPIQIPSKPTEVNVKSQFRAMVDDSMFYDLEPRSPAQPLEALPSSVGSSSGSSSNSSLKNAKSVSFKEMATIYEVERYLLTQAEQQELDQRIAKYGKVGYKIKSKIQKWLGRPIDLDV
ncbi:hypothetical protein HDV03_002658 [Kappamyces sp. JEL0829]|nr:hypothetical protein HDV03_002658 [Kappamyces sp. JEL0829]